ncbi:hypothetical protein GC163_17625 [bacterium]|nr:hypothetical protein [bacterium]
MAGEMLRRAPMTRFLRQPRHTVRGLACVGFWLAWTAFSPAQEAYAPGTTPFNTQLVVSEEFFNRFIARNEAEPGRVDDFVFGAKVDGEQWTQSQLRLDLRPNLEQASGTFVLTGQIQSLTVGRTEQGAVQSQGMQEFLAQKDVLFDGTQFSTRHAMVYVRAMNQPVAAMTQLDGTILQGLGQRIALSRATRQRPQTEAYTRDRIAERVYPKFDQSVDEQLSIANQQLGKVWNAGGATLRQLLDGPRRLVSTETAAHLAARIAVDDSTEAYAVPDSSLTGTHAISAYLHESLLNHLVRKSQLAGLKTSDRELKAMVDRAERLFPGLDPREESPTSPLAGMVETEIHFDEHNPLEFHLGAEGLRIEIRAKFKPAGQDLLPALLIQVPLKLVDRADRWVLERGKIEISSTDGQMLPSLSETLVRQALERDFPQREFPRTLTIPGWPASQPALQLTAVRAAEGWVAFHLD